MPYHDPDIVLTCLFTDPRPQWGHLGHRSQDCSQPHAEPDGAAWKSVTFYDDPKA